MNRKTLAAAVIALAAASAVTACSRSSSTPNTAAAPPTTNSAPASPFNDDNVVANAQRANASVIITEVRKVGGDTNQVLAALTSSYAETGWMSGQYDSGKMRDIFGWADSEDASDAGWAVAGATDQFMKVAATVSVPDTNPAAYAVAVNLADPRIRPGTFDEKEVADEYGAALPAAETALTELGGHLR